MINIKIIIIIIIILILFYKVKVKVKNKSLFNSDGDNILIIACHIKKNYNNLIIQNNLDFFNKSNKINKIIIVYSTEKDVLFNENLNSTIPIIYIHDKQNIYYDFYKYKMAYDYINSNLKFKWVFVTNDSIIICGDVSWIINKIVNSDKDYIGILEISEHIFENEPYKLHYQSWWLNFRPNAFNFFINNLKFNNSHLNVKNIINDYEINLSNTMINKFNNIAIFPLTTNYNGNIFLNDEYFYDYFYNKKFKFVKIKEIKPELIPSNLSILFKS